MEKNNAPITEFYSDKMENLFSFFANGKKEFWKFEEYKNIDKCIFFFPRDFRKLKQVYSKCKLVYQFKSASTISPVYVYNKKVFIALAPLGGPASANLMEELIFAGVKNFIGVGSCGAIVNQNLDNYFIPQKAIRDEGTSYHYLAPSRYVETSKKLSSAIEKVLVENNKPYNKGITWTTDAIYRETPSRIKSRIEDGAKVVEMECASLSAIAKSKNVDYACLLYYSDYNNGEIWNTRFYNKFKLRSEIIEYCVAAFNNI